MDSNKRFSYASTEPSSAGSHEDEGDLPFQPRQKYAPLPRNNTGPPAPEPEQQSRKSFSLKNAGRAFSFGAKSAKNVPKEEDIPPLPNRDRAMTASSYASTAVPPQLDLGGGTGLGLGATSEFGDLFGKRKSTIMEEIPPPPSIAVPPAPYVSQENLSRGSPSTSTQHTLPSPAHIPPPSRSPQPRGTYLNYSNDDFPPRDIPPRKTGSPYSFQTGGSEERLMASPHQRSFMDSPTFKSGPGFSGGTDESIVQDALNASRFLDNEHSPQPPRHIPDNNPLPRVRAPPRQPPPSSYRGPEPPRRSPLQDVTHQTPQERGDGFSDVPLGSQSSIVGGDDDEPLFDAPRVRKIFANTRSTTAPAAQTNKVMTPAEFAEYKKHKENAPPEEDEKSDSSSDAGDYEDDDETERQKEAARQRKKQEAHLAVYRQQMMKVTGEQPELPQTQPRRENLQRSSNSAPSLLGVMPFENKGGSSPEQGTAKSSEDEDEEIPLGVLQAHGFPNKNRPPVRVSHSSTSISRLDSTQTYPQPGGATRNDPSSGGGGNLNLPVFAKNLPQDPYVGASLVNQPTRESLAMNPHSMHAGSIQQHSPQPPPMAGNLPPGGLVGVIATEERAKALRRGSPNTRGTYDPVPSLQLPHEMQQQQMVQQMMQQQQMQQYQQQPQQTQNQMSAGEQTQLQIANQMTQMMQMQMQWMQMMMQNGGQAPAGMQPPPGMGMQPPSGPGTPQLPQQNFGQPNFLNTDPMARPGSMASNVSMGAHQRGMSNISRGPSPQHPSGMPNNMPFSSSQSVHGMQGPGPGYTPSIAPSERSTVGQPSRYRPVTPGATQNRDARTSTMSQNTVQPALRGSRSKSRLRNEAATSILKPSIKTVEKPKHNAQDDDDDDEGWAEMQRQRQARQNKWKQSKPSPTIPGAQEGGLEGLLYEGPRA